MKNKGITGTLFALANILQRFSELGAHVIGAAERYGYRSARQLAEIKRLQALELKNRLTFEKIKTEQHRTGVTANNIVIGDQKIERNELELEFLRAKLKNSGTGRPSFVAEGYPEPGDVRRGIMPPGGTHAK